MTNTKHTIIVSRKEIFENDTTQLIALLQSLEYDKLYFRNNVDILFENFKQNNIEFYEIPEVKLWIKTLCKQYNNWLYFLSMDKIYDFLIILLAVQSDATKVAQYQYQPNKKLYLEYIKHLIIGLDDFCVKNNISNDIIFEILDKFKNLLRINYLSR